MSFTPRLSIITPSYNQGAFIEETIKSVLAQDYPNLEHIVVDGGSTDNTIAVLKNYERSLHWISEPDHGQADAINKGLRMATGDIVAYLNSDDLYEPGALKTVGEFFACHSQAAWVTGRCRTINQSNQEIRRGITAYKNIWLHLHHDKVLYVLNYISQPATFWRRAVVARVGYFDETLHYTMDYEYWLRIISRNYRLWTLNVYLAQFRVHSSSKSGSTANAQFNEQLKVAQRYVHSSFVLALHQLHNAVSVAIYKQLLAGK